MGGGMPCNNRSKPGMIGALVFLSAVSAFAQTPPKPDIVFFIADDHSQLDASVYGAAPFLKTPNMTALMKAGMTFDNAFAASPACAPSRTAFLTGLMPFRNGAEANHTLPKDTLLWLTRKLHAAGYRVAAFGKVADASSGHEKGFDYWDDVPSRGDLSGAVAKYYAGLADKTKPVCLLVGDHRPHVSWIAKSIYTPAEVTLPPTFIDTKATREHRARYFTDVTGMDTELGKVYAWTKAHLGTHYVFLYSADHGAQWPFGKWNLYDAGIKVPLIVAAPGLIAPASRTQAMVSWIDLMPTFFDLAGAPQPQGVDGKSFKAVLTGAATAHRTEIFTTHTGDGNMNVFPQRSVRTDKFKYILNPYPQFYHSNHSDMDRLDGAGAYWGSWDSAAAHDSTAAAIRYRYYIRPREEFYSLADDPYEQHNLIGSGKFPAQVAELRKKVSDWLAEQKDTLLLVGRPYPITGPRPMNTDTIRPWQAPVALAQWHPPANIANSMLRIIPTRVDGRTLRKGSRATQFAPFQ